VTVVPSFVVGQLDWKSYNPGIPIMETEKAHRPSLEARVSGNDTSVVDWVFGVFGSWDRVDSRQTFNTGPSLTDFPSSATDDTYAVFGEAKYHFTSAFRAFAGLRYSSESKTFSGTQYTAPPSIDFTPAAIDAFGAGVPASGARTDHNISWRVGLEYDVAPHSMAYLSASRGNKAGGFFPAPGANTFAPELLTAYELGMRNRFFDNRLQLNVEAFYWKYTDKQESFLGVAGSGITYVVQNAGAARLYGVDVDLIGRMTQKDTFTASVEYNNTSYQSFAYDTITFGPPNTGCAVGPSLKPPPYNARFDCSGFPLIRAPKWSGSVGFTHDEPIWNGTLTFNADMRFSSSYYLSPEFTPIEKAAPYQIYDTSLSYSEDRWNVSAWVRNIGNTPVYTGGNPHPFLPLFMTTVAEPRTFGVTLGRKF
jgi:iron complex outermembrane receptor protein